MGIRPLWSNRMLQTKRVRQSFIQTSPFWIFHHRACFHDLGFGGEPARFLLGEDGAVVGGHDEDAAASADELTLDSQLLLERGGQTGRAGEVVSNAAVIDPDVHEVLPSWFPPAPR